MDLKRAIEILENEKLCAEWIAGLVPSNRRCNRECSGCRFATDYEEKLSAYTYIIDTLKRECLTKSNGGSK